MNIIQHYQHLIEQGKSPSEAYQHCAQRFGEPAIVRALATRESARRLHNVLVGCVATRSTAVTPLSFYTR